MKKVLKGTLAILIVVSLVLAMASCGGDSPSAVARKAITAIEKADQRGINNTFTPDAAAMIGSMLEKAQGQMKEKGGVAKTEETINGDKATVKVTYNDGSTDDITLFKVDGKWKVGMEK